MKRITADIMAKKPLRPVITAHSGCEGTPDNSMAHILAAIASGAEMLEVDVREKDGVLYMWHDAREDISDCVTLKECFRCVQPSSLSINCDLKTEGLVEAVLQLAADCGMEERIVFTGSVGAADLPALNASPADWWQGLWHSAHEEADLAAACSLYKELKGLYNIINIDQTMIDERVLSVVAEAGHPLSVWTVNTEENLRRIMVTGQAANITTRVPSLALKIRKELFGE